jgi:UrcA family protein
MPDLFESKYLWGLMAATALTLILAVTPAGAQEEYDDDGAYTGEAATVSDDEVLVTAPRARVRGEYGAPIRDVALSREVSFADLDLTTDEGAMILETRIRQTARNLCRQLDVMHPVKADNSPPCYQTAVDGAMIEATAVINDARGMAGDEE